MGVVSILCAYLLCVFFFLASCATVAVDQDLVKDYILMAETAAKDKLYDQARKYYLRVLQLDPKRTEVRYNILTMDLRLSDWVSASYLVNQLLQDDPGNGFLLEDQAFIYANNGEYEKAHAILAGVYGNGLRRESVIRNLFSLSGKLDKKDDQFKWGEELHREGKTDNGTLLSLIGCGLQIGKDEAVKVYIDEFLAANAQDVKQLVALGDVYVSGTWYARAIELADNVWDKEKLNPAVLVLRIKARLLAQDAPDEVNADLILFSESFPGSMALLGELLEKLPEENALILKTFLETKKDPAVDVDAGSGLPSGQ